MCTGDIEVSNTNRMASNWRMSDKNRFVGSLVIYCVLADTRGRKLDGSRRIKLELKKLWANVLAPNGKRSARIQAKLNSSELETCYILSSVGWWWKNMEPMCACVCVGDGGKNHDTARTKKINNTGMGDNRARACTLSTDRIVYHFRCALFALAFKSTKQNDYNIINAWNTVHVFAVRSAKQQAHSDLCVDKWFSSYILLPFYPRLLRPHARHSWLGSFHLGSDHLPPARCAAPSVLLGGCVSVCVCVIRFFHSFNFIYTVIASHVPKSHVIYFPFPRIPPFQRNALVWHMLCIVVYMLSASQLSAVAVIDLIALRFCLIS